MSRWCTRALALMAWCLATVCCAADWPQWRGPERNGVSREIGLLKQWPNGGPPLLWAVDGLGEGFSSCAIAGDCVYTAGMVQGKGFVFCLDLTGRLLWQAPYPELKYARSTPTVDGDRLWLMSAHGTVWCFAAKTGTVLWSVDTEAEFGAVQPAGGHGISESVALAGDVVICTPGGTKASVVGLDRGSGSVRWATRDVTEPSGFNQPLVIRRGPRRLAIVMTALSMLGVDAADGTVLWRSPYAKLGGQCFTPVWAEDVLYAPVGSDGAAAGFRLSSDGAKLTRIWTQRRMSSHHGGVVAVGRYVYGTHGHWRLACLDIRNGNVMFETPRKFGLGSVIWADGMLILSMLDGTARLVPASPQAGTLMGEFQMPRGSGPCYAHPALADGRLYLRRGASLMVYDLAQPR